MAFTELWQNMSITDFLTYPLTGDYYFYAKIMFGLWIILTSILFFEERDRLRQANLLSNMAVSSLAIIILSFIGSLFGIITNDILVSIVVLGCINIFVWFIRSD